MVNVNDEEGIKKLLGWDKIPNYSRYGFCTSCMELKFIDPPGGPFTEVANDCKCELELRLDLSSSSKRRKK